MTFTILLLYYELAGYYKLFLVISIFSCMAIWHSYVNFVNKQSYIFILPLFHRNLSLFKCLAPLSAGELCDYKAPSKHENPTSFFLAKMNVNHSFPWRNTISNNLFWWR